MNETVYALTLAGINMLVGGYLTTGGGQVSTRLASAGLGGGSGNGPPVIITTGSNFGFSKDHLEFGFDVSGAAGQNVAIDASTNLLNWVSVQTNVLGGSLWYFSDPYASNYTRRCCRAQGLP